MSLNKAMLIGRLGADPESRTTQSGTAVCNLRLATTERRQNDRDEWEDHTEWHRVVCFGRTAENASKYLEKGRQVYVEGRLQTRKWQDRDGNDRWSTEVVAFVVTFLGSKGEGNGGRGGDRSGGGRGGGDGYGGGGYAGGGGAADEDIPFAACMADDPGPGHGCLMLPPWRWRRPL